MRLRCLESRFSALASVVAALVLLYGTLCWGAKQTILADFSPLANGANPYSTLVSDAEGNLYGTTTNGGAYGTVFMLSPQTGGTWKEQVIHSFLGQSASGPDGAYPLAGVVFGPDGALYGTTGEGGTYGCGTVFRLIRLSVNGWSEQILHSFACYPNDGANPYASVTVDAAGNLYGTTSQGGNGECGYYSSYGCGTIFELSGGQNGSWTEGVLYSFQASSDGCVPASPLTLDSAGNLYGTAEYSNCYYDYGGTVFELSPGSTGWSLSTLYTFTGENDGGQPTGGLIFDSSSNLYGTTSGGGSSDKYGGGAGTVFELVHGENGWTEAVLYSFNGGSDGSNPAAGVIFDLSGNLYGTTQYGGSSSACSFGCGTVFELSPGSGGWTENVLYSFTAGQDGALPYGMVLLDGSGNLDITATAGGGQGCNNTVSGCGSILQLSKGFWKPVVLYDFAISDDGSEAFSTLVSDRSGNLYGTTEYGGSGQCSEYPPLGCGVVFELSLSEDGTWNKTIIYNFTGIDGDGSNPVGGVVFDSSGNLYGTTLHGGVNICQYNTTCGTVFELTFTNGSWVENVVHDFGGADGANPVAGLLATQYALFGTTQYGGLYDEGTVFAIAEGIESVIHSFGQNDGMQPQAPLISDDHGNLYGTTSSTVFELAVSEDTWKETVLHTFSDLGASNRNSGLVMDGSGNLYGTTSLGGEYDGGTVFELNQSQGWDETVLHNFTGVNGDGAYPQSGVILDNGGNLLGTTSVGGINGGSCNGLGCGVAFELSSSAHKGWKEHVLHRFTGGVDGGQPYGGLLPDLYGNLDGTTSRGGTGDQGVAFAIKVY